MKPIDIKVPSVGVDDAMEVIEIYVSEGDQVAEDDSIIVLESDKTTLEVPCPSAGLVKVLNVKIGDKLREGDSILSLEVTEDATEESTGAALASKKIETKESEPSDENEPEVNDKKLDAVSQEVLQEILVPDLGGSEQVEVIEISVSENQDVSEDDTLLVLESDKTTMDIPSPLSGVLKTLNVKLGDKVSPGDTIAMILSSVSVNAVSTSSISTEKAEAHNSESNTTQKDDRDNKEAPSLSVKDSAALSNQDATKNNAHVHAGPAVRRLARELGVDIARVKGHGPKGRILKEDLNAYIKQQVILAQEGETSQAVGVLPTVHLPDFSAFGAVEQSAMTKIQRLTAKNMQTSWLTVPHVTQFDEADITEMEVFRKQQKKMAEVKGIKLTPMAFLLKACAFALKQLPQFNVSIDMQSHQVFQKKYIHIGIAVDTPNGLMVPVIRDVDQKSLWELAQECQVLALKARDKKLLPGDLQGGCFTISSLGGLGGTAFTPIVNTPEVAILGVSKSQMKPVYDATSNEFMPRLMLPLSLSYDHRAVNGADAARFTSLLSSVLGDLRGLLL